MQTAIDWLMALTPHISDMMSDSHENKQFVKNRNGNRTKCLVVSIQIRSHNALNSRRECASHRYFMHRFSNKVHVFTLTYNGCSGFYSAACWVTLTAHEFPINLGQLINYARHSRNLLRSIIVSKYIAFRLLFLVNSTNKARSVSYQSDRI